MKNPYMENMDLFLFSIQQFIYHVHTHVHCEVMYRPGISSVQGMVIFSLAFKGAHIHWWIWWPMGNFKKGQKGQDQGNRGHGLPWPPFRPEISSLRGQGHVHLLRAHPLTNLVVKGKRLKGQKKTRPGQQGSWLTVCYSRPVCMKAKQISKRW